MGGPSAVTGDMVCAVRGMEPEDLYALSWVSDPRISPDGRDVAFVVTSVDKESNSCKSAIWTAAADGSSAPRRFTSGEKKDLRPRWSADGKRLAFVSTREHDTPQLYVIDIGGGEALRLTDLKEAVGDLAWSPDGASILFASRVREGEDEPDAKKRPPKRITRLRYKLDDVGWVADRRTHLFTVPSDGSTEPVQLTDGDFEDGSFAWSPDGARVVVTSSRAERWDTGFIRDLYIVDAAGGEPVLVTGGDGVCDAPSWSPEGERIAYRYSPETVDDYPRNMQIAVLDVASRTRQILTASLDRNCGPYPEVREPIWHEGALLFALEDGGNVHLYRVSPEGLEEPKVLIGGELTLTGCDASDGTLVHTASTATRPPELFCGERQLTQVTRPFCDRIELVAPERFTTTSPDGSEVDAWIVRPAGFVAGRRYPVLLNIHGGPFTQYGNRFFDEFQVYAGAGYAVLYSNPRGSSGYSEEWGRAIRGPGELGPGMGSVDFDDLMAVTDEALRRYDFCDPNRLGVMGGSYGGFMTTWIVGHTDRFRAGCSERAVNNWVSFFGSSDEGFAMQGYLGTLPFFDAETYLSVSPTQWADGIHTPLLLVHSDDDLRAPVEQAEHLFTVLRLLGREVEFVRFPAEGHELSRSGSPAHRLMRFEAILDWFSGYLQVVGESPSIPPVTGRER